MFRVRFQWHQNISFIISAEKQTYQNVQLFIQHGKYGKTISTMEKQLHVEDAWKKCPKISLWLHQFTFQSIAHSGLSFSTSLPNMLFLAILTDVRLYLTVVLIAFPWSPFNHGIVSLFLPCKLYYYFFKRHKKRVRYVVCLYLWPHQWGREHDLWMYKSQEYLSVYQCIYLRVYLWVYRSQVVKFTNVHNFRVQSANHYTMEPTNVQNFKQHWTLSPTQVKISVLILTVGPPYLTWLIQLNWDLSLKIRKYLPSNFYMG